MEESKFTVLIKRPLFDCSEVFYANSVEGLEKILRREKGSDSVLKANPSVGQVGFSYRQEEFQDDWTFVGKEDKYKSVKPKYYRTDKEQELLGEAKDLDITSEEIEVIRTLYQNHNGNLSRNSNDRALLVEQPADGEVEERKKWNVSRQKFEANEKRYNKLLAKDGKYDKHQWRLTHPDEYKKAKEAYDELRDQSSITVLGSMSKVGFKSLWKNHYANPREVSISKKLFRGIGTFVDAFLTFKNLFNPSTWAGLAFSALTLEFLLSVFSPAAFIAAAPALTTIAIIGGVLTVPALLYFFWALKEDFDAQIVKNKAELDKWEKEAALKSLAAKSVSAAPSALPVEPVESVESVRAPEPSFRNKVMLYCKTLPSRFKEWAKKDAIDPKWFPVNGQAVAVFLGLSAAATFLVLSSVFLSGAGAQFMEPLFHSLITTLINGLHMVIPSLDVAAPGVMMFAKIITSLFLILAPLTLGVVAKRLGQTANEAQLVANKLDDASVAKVEREFATRESEAQVREAQVREALNEIKREQGDLWDNQDTLHKNIETLNLNQSKASSFTSQTLIDEDDLSGDNDNNDDLFNYKDSRTATNNTSGGRGTGNWGVGGNVPNTHTSSRGRGGNLFSPTLPATGNLKTQNTRNDSSQAQIKVEGLGLNEETSESSDEEFLNVKKRFESEKFEVKSKVKPGPAGQPKVELEVEDKSKAEPEPEQKVELKVELKVEDKSKAELEIKPETEKPNPVEEKLVKVRSNSDGKRSDSAPTPVMATPIVFTSSPQTKQGDTLNTPNQGLTGAPAVNTTPGFGSGPGG
jgi:hypothetical protein